MGDAMIVILAAAVAACGTFTIEGEGSVVQGNTISGYDVKGLPAGSGNRAIPCKEPTPRKPVMVSCRGPYDIRATTWTAVDGQRLKRGCYKLDDGYHALSGGALTHDGAIGSAAP